MGSFQTEIRQRIAENRRQLAAAESDGDHWLVENLVGEQESLARLAAEHHVTVDLANDLPNDLAGAESSGAERP